MNALMPTDAVVEQMVAEPETEPTPEPIETPEVTEETIGDKEFRFTDESVRWMTDIMVAEGYNDEKEFADAIDAGRVDMSKYANPEGTQESETPTGEGATETTTPSATQQTPAETGKPATPSAPEDVEIKRLRGIEQLYGRQANELGQLRAQLDEVKPLLNSLQDPNFRQHVLNYGSPAQQPSGQGDEDTYLTKADLTRMLSEERNRQSVMTRAQQTEMIKRNFSQATTSRRDELVKSGVPVDTLESFMADFQKQIMTGNAYNLAYKAMMFDKAVADAEKRGRDKTVQEIQKKKDYSPPRTVRVAASQPSQGGKPDYSKMGEAELQSAIKTTKEGTPEWERLGRFIASIPG